MGPFKLEKHHILWIILSAMLLAGYFFPGHLWIFSNPFFMPLSLQIVFWFLMLLIFFDDINSFVYRYLKRFETFFYSRKTVNILISLFILGTIFGLLFQCRHYFWGDSHMIVGILEKLEGSAAFDSRRWLTGFVYWTFISIGRSIGWEMLTSLKVLHSIACGLFFVLAYEFSRLFFRSKRAETTGSIFIFLGLIRCGGVLLFTHPELYIPGFICAFYAIYLLIKNWELDSLKRFAFVIPMVIAVLFHPLYIYLGIAFLFLIIGKKFKLTAVIATLSAIGLYWILALFMDLPFERLFLPVFSPQYMFSVNHLATLLSLVLFAAFPIIGIIFKPGKLLPKQDKSDILAGLTIVSLLFFSTLNLEMAELDWDLATAIILPVILYGPVILNRLNKKTKTLILNFMAISLLSWLFLNLSLSDGQNKAEKILETRVTPYFENRIPEERITMIYLYGPDQENRSLKVNYWGRIAIEKRPYLDRPYLYMMVYNITSDNREKAAYFGLKGYQNDAVNVRFNLYFLSSIYGDRDSKRLSSIDDITDAARNFKSLDFLENLSNRIVAYSDSTVSIPDNYSRNLNEILLVTIAANLSSSNGDFEFAEDLYRAASRIYSNSPTLSFNRGILYSNLNRFELARQYLHESLHRGNPPGITNHNIGIAFFKEQIIDSAKIYIERAIQYEPERFGFRKTYSSVLWLTGQQNMAIEYIDEFAQSAAIPEQAAKARHLKEIMKSQLSP